MTGMLVGYARVSTNDQDLTALKNALAALGVSLQMTFTDQGLFGTNRARPGLREALAACRAGDTLVVTKREALFRENFDEILEDWTGGEAPGLKDKDDQHVHNAAVYCQADILLTMNIKDFGDPDLPPYHLYTPDQFFCLVESSYSFLVREVTRSQNSYWQNRRAKGDSVTGLAEALEKAGCPKFAAIVAKHLRMLSGPT